jgi:hypothetical protein
MILRAPKKTNRKRDRMSERFSELLKRENTVRLDEVDRSLVGCTITTDGQWKILASADSLNVIWIVLTENGEVAEIPFAAISIGRDSEGRPIKVSARHDAEEPIESEVIELEWCKEAANPLFTAICACINRAVN